MTKGDQRYEQFRHSHIGRIITHPVVLLMTSIMSVLAIVTALYVLYGLGQQSGKSAAVARREAAAAVQKAETAQAQAAQARAASSNLAREQLCTLVRFNADTSIPPTTARGFQIAESWKKFGESPLLHCFTEAK